MTRDHHRPVTVDAAYFESVAEGPAPDEVREIADRTASVLVRGARAQGDRALAERVVHLADTEGMETLADMWSSSTADSLAGSLWRLYVVREWIHADPVRAARAFEAGTSTAQVALAVAGVADPPDPEAMCHVIDDVLRGIVHSDFADVLWRASAVVHVMSAGRALTETRPSDVRESARMITLAEELQRAGHLELAGRLS
ncbi:MAG: hypothetical protein HY829_04555 [Actinobacteria bacterium]|nr:hypothetical protein [Actinomycetota bacterium]